MVAYNAAWLSSVNHIGGVDGNGYILYLGDLRVSQLHAVYRVRLINSSPRNEFARVEALL